MAKGDDRATIGASGRPERGMVLDSGARTIRNKLGQYEPHNNFSTRPGVKFDVDGMRDMSIGKAPDPSET